MANLQSLTVNDTGNLTLPSGTSAQRPSLSSLTTIRWTNTGSQSYSVLAGTTPTLSNTSWTCPVGVTNIEVLVVAGGGSGAGGNGGGAGGGGAGGVIYTSAYSVVPGNSYTVTVGAGGASSNRASTGFNGANSVFGTLTAIGGGGGGCNNAGGVAGGSGGGSGEYSTATSGAQSAIGFGGAGTTGQGFKGGDTSLTGAGSGGGGAGGAGVNTVAGTVGAGGPGLAFSITGTTAWYAGGGGASGNSLPGSLGGSGVGGNGGAGSGGSGTVTAGAASTGAGGGGIYVGGSGAGGSGVVIIRYSLTAAGTQDFGRTRINTESATIETFNFNNQWNSNNLILHIDVGNASSYSGSGTAWNDLSGNNNHGTLINSPTYTSSGGGYFTFNGTNQYASFPIANRPDCYAFEIGIKQWKAVINYPETDMGPYYSCVGIVAQPNVVAGYSYANLNGLNIGGWTGTMDRETISWWNYASGINGGCYIRPDVSFAFHIYTINWNGYSYDIWLDGVKYPTFQRSAGALSCALLKKIQTVNVGYGNDNTLGYYFKGDIGHIKMFSKPLSDYAVTQSYLLNKTRYGL